MKVLITENQKKDVIQNLIKDKGWEVASTIFGGLGELIQVFGMEGLVNFLLGTYFDNLKIRKWGQSFMVNEGYTLIMEKPSSFWSSDIRVYDAFLRSVLSEIPKLLYIEVRKDLIKKIISMFPELSDVERVVVYEDPGLYKIHERFNLDIYKEN